MLKKTYIYMFGVTWLAIVLSSETEESDSLSCLFLMALYYLQAVRLLTHVFYSFCCMCALGMTRHTQLLVCRNTPIRRLKQVMSY
jgi:hypothetical protein